MFNGKDRVTLIMSYYDKASGKDVYKTKIFSGCSWQERLQAAQSQGLNPKKKFIIRIPGGFRCVFREYDDWVDSGGIGWTCIPGFKLVRGAITETESYQLSTMQGSGVCTVTSFTDNTKKPLSHYLVEGE